MNDPFKIMYTSKQKTFPFHCRFTCECVEKVKQKGYSVFGLQWQGECWSGPRAACDYKVFGTSQQCVNENKVRCNDESSKLCSGLNTHLYVYIPTDTPGGLSCPTTFPTTPKIITNTQQKTTPTDKITTTKKITTQVVNTTPTQPITTPFPTGPPNLSCSENTLKLTKLGCWSEFGHVRPPRAFPELLLTARSASSNVYAGYQYTGVNYDAFIKRYEKLNSKAYPRPKIFDDRREKYILTSSTANAIKEIEIFEKFIRPIFPK